jgi:hypothetical protein
MIGAILFDVDGTLIDSNDLHAAAWQEAFRHFGLDIPMDTIRGQIGKGGDNLIPALVPKEVEKSRYDEIENFRSELFKRDYLPRVVPFRGVRELFERIAQDGKKIVPRLVREGRGGSLSPERHRRWRFRQLDHICGRCRAFEALSRHLCRSPEEGGAAGAGRGGRGRGFAL